MIHVDMSAQLDGNLAAEQGDMKAAGQDGGVSLPHCPRTQFRICWFGWQQAVS